MKLSGGDPCTDVWRSAGGRSFEQRIKSAGRGEIYGKTDIFSAACSDSVDHFAGHGKK